MWSAHFSDALWHWAPAVQLPLAVLLIAGLGLQHGALDHILHAHMHGDPEGPLRQSFALPYIAGIGVAWGAFESAPGPMLGLFLLVSAYHFGMSHLRVDALRLAPPAHRRPVRVGARHVPARAIDHPARRSGRARRSAGNWTLDGSELSPLQFASVSAILMAGILHRSWRNGLLALSGIMLAWFVHDLLLAFALYFALGHSREAFFEEFKERQMSRRTFAASISKACR